MKMKNLYRCY